MDGIYWLYSIENKINGKKYIGWTINPTQRWKQHVKNATSSNTKQYVHKAMKSYGVNNFWFNCIEFYFSEKDALTREKELIKLFHDLFGKETASLVLAVELPLLQ